MRKAQITGLEVNFLNRKSSFILTLPFSSSHLTLHIASYVSTSSLFFLIESCDACYCVHQKVLTGMKKINFEY